MNATLARGRGIAAVLAPALIGLLGAAAYLPAAFGNTSASQFGDALTYQFMADVLTPWRHASDFALAVYRASRFPPLFPAALGLLGIGSDSVRASHVFEASMTVLAAVLAAVYARRLQGSALAALSIGIAFLFAPLTIRNALEIGSEPLFLVLSLLTLLAVSMREERDRDARDLLPGLLAGFAILTREVGVVFLPALLIWSWRRRSGWAFAGIAIAALEMAGWHALRSIDEQNVSYATSLTYLTRGGALGVAERAPAALGGFFLGGWIGGASFGGNLATKIAAALVLACALPAWLSELRRGGVLAVSAALYVGVFAIWDYPGFTARFASPLVVPVALFAWRSIAAPVALFAWRSIAALPAPRSTTRVLAAVVVLAPAMIELPFVVSRAMLATPPEDAAFRFQEDWFKAKSDAEALRVARTRRKAAALLAAIPGVVRPEQRICALECEFAAQGARRGFVRLPPPWELAVDVPWIERSCDYVYVSVASLPEHGIPPYYPDLMVRPPHRARLASVMDAPGRAQPVLVSALVPVAPYEGATELVP